MRQIGHPDGNKRLRSKSKPGAVSVTDSKHSVSNENDQPEGPISPLKKVTLVAPYSFVVDGLWLVCSCFRQRCPGAN